MSLRDVVNAGVMAQNDHLIQKTSDLNKQNQHVREQALANNLQARDEINDLEEENEKLRKENAFLKALLARPMAEIATINSSFKETHEKQQELIGNWIVSQRAFKEVAIKLGVQLGKKPEEVIAEGIATKVKVIDGETEHGNNFIENENDEWAIYYAPRVKARFINKE